MITPFGKQVRKYRIDMDMTLGDMAKELRITPSYLSAMETGRRPITDDFLERVVDFFSSHGIDASGLRQLADHSRREISLQALSEHERSAIAVLARRLPEMSIADRERLATELKRLAID